MPTKPLLSLTNSLRSFRKRAMSQRILDTINDPDFEFKPIYVENWGRNKWVSKTTNEVVDSRNIRKLGLSPALRLNSEGNMCCKDLANTNYELKDGVWKVITAFR